MVGVVDAATWDAAYLQVVAAVMVEEADDDAAHLRVLAEPDAAAV